MGDGIGNIMGLKVATNAFMTGGALTVSGVRASYNLSKKTARRIGTMRAYHAGIKEHGFKNVARAQFKNAFTGGYKNQHSKASEKINQWFTDK
ncbi:hypothetical protein D9R21_07460 [Spiroplasma endosymbiont of Megaselia nigra]|nr:hypothetical protein D9R21_07460 [Spiroplasma endosymbiont of Megaselia nigra]